MGYSNPGPGGYNRIPGDPKAQTPVVWQMPHPDQLPGASVGPTFYPRPLPKANLDLLHTSVPVNVFTGPPPTYQSSSFDPGKGPNSNFHSPRNPPQAALHGKAQL